MDEFFLHLKNLRHGRGAAVDPGLAESFELYNRLMEDLPLSESESRWLHRHLSDVSPEMGPAHLLHRLWLLNSWSRSLCFTQEDFTKANEVLINALRLSANIFAQNFNVFEAESKLFALFIPLNLARVEARAGRTENARKLFTQLEIYCEAFDARVLSNFPVEVQQFFFRFADPLRSCLGPGHLEYFVRKIRSALAGLPQPTLLEICDARADEQPRAIAFRDFDTQTDWDWQGLRDLSLTLASKMKVPRSDRAMALICTTQNILLPGLLLACWRKGVTPVFLHEDFTDFEFSGLRKVLGEQEIFLYLDSSLSAAAREKFHRWGFDAQEFDREIFADPPAVYARKSGQMALGLLTSGTSSLPKLILFSPAELAAASEIECENENFRPGKWVCNLRPHFTSAGLNTLWASLRSGAPNLLSEKIRRRPLARFVTELLKEREIDLLVLSPAAIRLMLDSAESLISSRLLNLYFGGGALPPTMIAQLKSHNFIPEMRYGMTEVGHIISKRRLSSTEENAGRVGRPHRGFEIRVDHQNLSLRSAGSAGFQMADGKMVALKDEDGWFRTEDRGSILPDSEIELAGREHEILAVNGFRFHADQVVAALLQSPEVSDARVLGFADERSGQRVVAFCIASSARTSAKINFLEILPSFKRPHYYHWLESWPAANNGKIDLKRLREIHLEAYAQLTAEL